MAEQSVTDGLSTFANHLEPSGLVNRVTGLGTSKDKARVGSWHFDCTSPEQLEYAYRSNPWAAKVVDIPADDMMREGWAFDDADEDCQAFEAEVKRLNVEECVKDTLINARLYGGAYIYMSDGSEDVSLPLSGPIAFIKAMTCYELHPLSLELDLSSPRYGEPSAYTAAIGTGGLYIDPSRVIPVIGKKIPRRSKVNTYAYEIGDSVLETVLESIKDATSTQQGIATLVQEAKVDVFKIDGFMKKIANKIQEQAFLQRFSLVQRMKSNNGSVVLDTKDEYEQKQVNFAGLTDIELLLLQIVSGSADIPATRFLSQSPSGMNATGDSDIRNYYDSLSAKQESKLRPCLNILFDAIAEGMGKPAPEYTFKPLWQMDEAQKSEIAHRNAQTAVAYANLAVIDPAELREGIASRIERDGIFPAFEFVAKAPEPEDVNGGIEE